MYIIGKDRQGVRRQYIVFKDNLEEINGYSCYRVAIRNLIERIPTDFVPIPQYNNSPSDSYENENEAWAMLEMWLKENKITYKKENEE